MAQDDVSSGPAHPLIESDHIEGTAVYDANGQRIGTIKRLVIEKVSGHVAYAITSFGGFPGHVGEPGQADAREGRRCAREGRAQGGWRRDGVGRH
jgi:hypothetical protein